MKIICWWSGGVTSAMACKLAIDLYGVENCEFIFIDTYNEDKDTYRFKNDCQRWYKGLIGSITGIGSKYNSIKNVWYKHRSLNTAKGAICSSELKRRVREIWEKNNKWNHQVFGFDITEVNRAIALKKNHSHTKPIFPLLMYAYTKKDCIEILQENNIEPPRVYSYGYLNNNCFNTGCVQGGIGYWQKIQREFPEKFNNMAIVEHNLTELKDKPITMLKDQSKGGGLVFLKKHPKYPDIKCIDDMEGREPEPLFECNGFCGTNDLIKRKESEQDINYQLNLFE